MDKRDTMVESIALSSPNGRMSRRARRAAQKRLAEELFGNMRRAAPVQPTEREVLLRRAAQLRELAARGMGVKKHIKEAIGLEKEAANMK